MRERENVADIVSGFASRGHSRIDVPSAHFLHTVTSDSGSRQPARIPANRLPPMAGQQTVVEKRPQTMRFPLVIASYKALDQMTGIRDDIYATEHLGA